MVYSRRKTEGSKLRFPVVAHVTRKYYSLTENWIHTQVQHLSRYKPIVLTETTENLESHSIPEYCALKELPGFARLTNMVSHRLAGYPTSFSKMIRKKNAQLIHAHFGFTAYKTLPLALRTGLPLVTTFYGVDASKLPAKYPVWREYYGKLFRYSTRFLVEGNHMRSQLINLGCPKNKITVQHLGIDLSRYPFEHRRIQKGQPMKILAAARFTEKKGLLYAIEAFTKIIKKNVNSRLTIIGDADSSGDPGYVEESQSTKQELLNAIKRNCMDDKITLLGFKPHDVLVKEFYNHHIFLSPSVQTKSGDNEGGAPVTLIEAGASGMPVIATCHCDIPEVVQDGVTGMLAPERNSGALAEYLLTFVNNPQLLSDMGLAAHKHITKEYDAITQGVYLEAIYDEVVKNPF